MNTGTEIVMVFPPFKYFYFYLYNADSKTRKLSCRKLFEFFPSYFSMASVDATLPATPFSQVHSADISSFRLEISHNNESLTRFFKNHVHTLIFQYQEVFPLLFYFSSLAQHTASLLFPPQPANVSASRGMRPCFLCLKQYMATKEK